MTTVLFAVALAAGAYVLVNLHRIDRKYDFQIRRLESETGLKLKQIEARLFDSSVREPSAETPADAQYEANLKQDSEDGKCGGLVTTYCDGSYPVQAWILASDEVMLGLKIGDGVINAGLMSLSEAERRLLRTDFHRLEDECGRQFEMNLRLNVLHDDHSIKRVAVVGRAAPREESVPLQNLIASLR